MYKVKRLYQKGVATDIASFRDSNEAKFYIEAALERDARLKSNTTYQLFEGMDLMEEFKQGDSEGTSSSSAGGGQGTQQKSGFQPTPFNAAPRPPGLPPNWLKDEEEDDKKK